MLPSIIEKNGTSSQVFDLPTKLLSDRIVYLNGVIDDKSANDVIMQMLWLNSNDPSKPINFYINSPGGLVYQGLGIKDIIDTISSPVNTVGIGLCASMGSYLLFAGTGERKATKNCRIMLHSVAGGLKGTIQDMKVDYEETKFLQDQMVFDIASFSKGKKTLEEVKNMCDRDYYISSYQAKELGFIDSIVGDKTS